MPAPGSRQQKMMSRQKKTNVPFPERNIKDKRFHRHSHSPGFSGNPKEEKAEFGVFIVDKSLSPYGPENEVL